MAKTSTKLGIAIAIVLLALLAGGLVRRARRPQQDEQPARAPRCRRAASMQRPRYRRRSRSFSPASRCARSKASCCTTASHLRARTVHLADAETRTALGDVTSGPDGRFTFGARAPAAYDVTATATKKLARRRVDLRAPITRVELSLMGCSKLEGFVLDGSGAPIEHARVVALEAPTPFAETDAQGHYELCARLGRSWFEYTASGYGGVTQQLEMHASFTHDVTLVPEAIVAGTVVTADDKPVPDAWVTVDPFDKGYARRAVVRAHTDAAGTFRIAGIAAGRNQVSAVAAGLASRRIEVVAGAGQVVEGLVVRVERGARITGVVKLGDMPVAGAGIGMRVGGLRAGTTAANANTVAVTQADGSFTIDRVPYWRHRAVRRRLHRRHAARRARRYAECRRDDQGRSARDDPRPRHPSRRGGSPCDRPCPGSAEPTKDDGSYACTGAAPGSHVASPHLR